MCFRNLQGFPPIITPIDYIYYVTKSPFCSRVIQYPLVTLPAANQNHAVQISFVNIPPPKLTVITQSQRQLRAN